MDEEIRACLRNRRTHEAFELLMNAYQHRVFRLAWSILGNAALAEEASQDSFLRIWKALPGFRGHSSLSTWVYAIARNTALTLSKSRHADHAPLDQRMLEQLAAHSQPAAPVDWERALQQMPEKYRQVLLLFYMQERSYEEVAAMLDLPIGTVKTNLHRAKKELAEKLALTGQPQFVRGSK